MPRLTSRATALGQRRQRRNSMAIIVFLLFVVFVVGLSLYLGNRAKTASGYYAAGGNIHWGVNGIAFAGDYLSAASFLGICGLIATAGYDGFLYSIGYLAGWIVALFVVAEPLQTGRRSSNFRHIRHIFSFCPGHLILRWPH